MNVRRINDQIAIMDGIMMLKGELSKAHHSQQPSYVTTDILLRLNTLYGLLDIPRLKELTEQADTRTNKLEVKKAS